MIFLIGILGIFSLHLKFFGHFCLYLVTITWLEQVLSVLWLVLAVHGVLSLLPFTCLLPFTSLLFTILFVLIILLIFPIIIFITCKIIPNLYLLCFLYWYKHPLLYNALIYQTDIPKNKQIQIYEKKSFYRYYCLRLHFH